MWEGLGAHGMTELSVPTAGLSQEGIQRQELVVFNKE